MGLGAVPPWKTNPSHLAAALKYAALGIEVLPVHSIVDNACTCGNPECASPGKHPYLENGFHGATTHEPTIRAWWQTRFPAANIGARPRGVGLVVDVDPRNGGEQGLEAFVCEYGRPEPTITAMTGGGGTHFWFKTQPIKNFKGKGEFSGLDIISATGYVVMPPSKHLSGGKYTFEASTDLLDGGAPEFALIPETWRRVLTNPAPNVQKTPAVHLTKAPAGELADVQKALSNLSADDYDTWVKVGMALHGQCWNEGFALWDTWSAKSEKYPGDNILRQKWASFTTTGSVGLATIFHLASAPRIPPLDGELWTDASHLLMPVNKMIEHVAKGQELVADAITEGALVQLFGPSGQGKTFLALDLSLRVAAGLPWASHATTQSPVVYVNGEGRQGLARRLKAWLTHNRVDDLSLPFFVTTQSLALTAEEQTAALIEAVQHVQARLVVVDTLARNFGGDENSTQDMGAFVQQMERLHRQTKAAVVVIHHTGHATQERGRGSSSLTAAVDVEFRAIRDNDLICLTNTKQRDLETLDDLMFESEIVNFEDENGEELSSLIVAPTDKQPVKLELVSGAQREFLQTVERMQAETAERLAAMGKAGADATVSRRELARELDHLTTNAIRVLVHRLTASGHLQSNRHEVWIQA